MDPERKKCIDKALATFFFGCNIPFVNVESEYFIAMLKVLNPEYSPPTRKTLSSSILNKMYEEHRLSVRNDVVKPGVLLIDGWKNSVANTKNVVAVVRTNDQNIFLESWNLNETRETGQILSTIVNQCITIALNQYNIDIYAVLSDNASNMINMGNRVNLWHLTCNSHSGNLLFKNLTNSEMDKKISDVVKDFRSPNLESQILNAGGRKMKIAGETRWCSRRDSYRRCLQNVGILRNIIHNNQLKEPQEQYIFRNQVIETVLDPEFEMKLIDALINYDPVCELVNGCQKSDCSISVATEKWLSLQLRYGENANFEKILKDRLLKVINPYVLAANYLHPKFKGQSYEGNLQYETMKNNFFSQNLSQDGIAQLEQYKNQTGIFQRLFERQFDSWQVFWKAAYFFCPELSILAEKLLRIPASTGDLERLFSEWAYVHNKTRNRLSEKKSKKLIALYYKYRLKYVNLYEDEEEDDEEDSEDDD